MTMFTKSTVEEAAFSWFEELGCAVVPRRERGNEVLATFHDALLPMLLRGEICLADAQRIAKGNT